MNNGMQLKAYLKNLAQENGTSPQLMLQEMALDNLLERISISKYKNNLILKGGFLVGSLIGLNIRSTMDMDTTLKGITVDSARIKGIFDDICKIDLTEDDMNLKVTQIEDIRETDDYDGFRIHIQASIFQIQTIIKVDVSIGDKLTPKEIKYKHKLIVKNKEINIMSYNLETLLAEKMETVISRDTRNSRGKDYYDLYILSKLDNQNVDYDLLKEALNATASKRGTEELIADYADIIDRVNKSDSMNDVWTSYQKNHIYARDIEFNEICDVISDLFSKVVIWND